MTDLQLNPGSTLTGGRSRRSRSSRVLGALSALLVALGALALLDAAVTLVWQEPISALYTHFEQDRLGGALRAVERAQPTVAERRVLASLPDERRRIAFLARRLERHTLQGEPVGRIDIPSIGADFVIVQGTHTAALEEGPGIYSKASFAQASFPGLPGTTAIAGHRTTFLAPFRHIDALREGDHITLRMPYARFLYTVTSQRVVQPTDVEAAVDNVGYTRLVLSACTPLFSAAERLLVFARLSETVPLGVARRLPRNAQARPIIGWQ
jgi:sortase A